METEDDFKILRIGLSINPETHELHSIATQVWQKNGNSESENTHECCYEKMNRGAGFLSFALFLVLAKFEITEQGENSILSREHEIMTSARNSPAASLSEILQGSRAGKSKWVRHLFTKNDPPAPTSIDISNAAGNFKSFMRATALRENNTVSVYLRSPHPDIFVFFRVPREDTIWTFKSAVSSTSHEVDLVKCAKAIVRMAGNTWRNYYLPKHFEEARSCLVKRGREVSRAAPDNLTSITGLQLTIKKFTKGNVPTNKSRISELLGELALTIASYDDIVESEISLILQPASADSLMARGSSPRSYALEQFRMIFEARESIPDILQIEVIASLAHLGGCEPYELIDPDSGEYQELKKLSTISHIKESKKTPWYKNILKSYL